MDKEIVKGQNFLVVIVDSNNFELFSIEQLPKSYYHTQYSKQVYS